MDDKENDITGPGDGAGGGRVLVVIVSYNSADYITGCLDSLARQTYRDIEVALVDNASSDGTPERAAGSGAHIIRSDVNLGFAAANNLGVSSAFERSGFEYVLLLNPDIVADERMVEELVRTLQSHSSCGIAQGKLFMMRDRDIINTDGNRLNYLYFGYCGGYGMPDTGGGDREVGYASGACMMFRMEVLERLGYLFDDDFFMYHEDTDFCVRARLMGYSTFLSAGAVAWHDYSFSAAKSKFFHMEKNRLFLVLQNYRAVTILLLLPVLAFTELQVLMFSAISGWLGWKLRSYLWLISNLGKVMARRRAVQAGRSVGELEMLRHMVTDISFEEVDNPGLRHITNPVLKLYYRFVVRVVGFFGGG